MHIHPIYLASFMRALLVVGVDVNDQNLLRTGALRWSRMLAMRHSVAELRLSSEVEIGGCLWVTDKRHSRVHSVHGDEKVG